MKYDKFICVTTAYCNWQTFECQEDMLHNRFHCNLLDERWCILGHYPQKDNIKNITRVCDKYKISVYDPIYNKGASGNINSFLEDTNQPSNTLMIKIDPDLMPPVDFDLPIRNVAEADRNLAVISLWNSTLPPIELSDHICVLAHCAVAFYDSCKLGAIYAIDIDFLREAGGMASYYGNWGGTEGKLYDNVKRLKRKWGYIMNIKEEYPIELAKLLDESYQLWKWSLLTKKFVGTYEDFIKEGSDIVL